jgi:hypothetical protein
MTLGDIHTCVACGGKEICFGYLGNTPSVFVPSGIFTISGFRIRSYVCLNCGYLGHYIPKDKLQKLKERFVERLGSAEDSPG